MMYENNHLDEALNRNDKNEEGEEEELQEQVDKEPLKEQRTQAKLKTFSTVALIAQAVERFKNAINPKINFKKENKKEEKVHRMHSGAFVRQPSGVNLTRKIGNEHTRSTSRRKHITDLLLTPIFENQHNQQPTSITIP